ncbi:DoxX family protein [Actinoplanes sp. N902-109]|uniref:DoxX family protein n=1 Tax=Actinoplanes sp. (strain N902-109) TaxID=649831 RepID=UPI00032943F7|nr:DoxX family protein [Actinoplanes sp. N902-109]AGL20274.1 integral membrane protein [Actinoplanes sp. N902-109]
MDTHKFAAPVWSVFRIVVGLLFALHGAASVFGVFGGNQGSGKAVEVGVWPGWYAGLIQLVCGILVMVGLFTRPAAVLASGSMAYAYFVVHQPKSLLPLQNGGDAPALFAWAFLMIAVLGAGSLSLDALLRRRSATAPAAVTPAAEEPIAEPATA